MAQSPLRGQLDCTAALGPPCTSTTSGYFLLASKFAGKTSQPCTSYESDFHRRLLASPQADFTFLFRCVICFQSPLAPAQTSGGAAKELRTAPKIFPSADGETEGPQVPAETWSAPRYSESILPPAGSIEMMDESPPTNSPAISFPSRVHPSQLADALRSGVRFCALPPSAGTNITSPPTEPKSLINPSMNAMDFPSGDHAGKFI